jgi:malate dehydrogenase
VKVTILGGGGGVGASAAFNLLAADASHDVVIVDEQPHMATSHAMDLEQLLALRPGHTIRVGDEGDLVDADVLVYTAAVPLTVNRSRLVYLEANAAILRGIAARLADAGEDWQGVLLMVTNPVDPLVTCAREWTGADRRRVIGYTLNDSVRLRLAVAGALGLPAHRVQAWVLGEHGDAAVPLFERVLVDGEPVALDADQRATADGFVRTWYQRHVALDSGRSSTWGTGLGIALMVDALGRADGATWPASVVLEGEYGIDGVALTVPVALGPGGVERIEEWDLADSEQAALRRAAEAVDRAQRAVSVSRSTAST